MLPMQMSKNARQWDERISKPIDEKLLFDKIKKHLCTRANSKYITLIKAKS
jgi:hypothetical protein